MIRPTQPGINFGTKPRQFPTGPKRRVSVNQISVSDEDAKAAYDAFEGPGGHYHKAIQALVHKSKPKPERRGVDTDDDIPYTPSKIMPSSESRVWASLRTER